ncbi:hypothetical protein GGR50DRAFT_342053 [Xylaria sp. CBS 124048]|nr:hypothetical protein GGR50DRAFT_342053 [Xylaria sp. CBS 124048]
MALPTPLPTYVYKIVPAAPPAPIPAQYPPSELDEKDGFIHLSTAIQVPLTADMFFTDVKTIWVVKVRFRPEFHGITTWDGTGCAHLYGNFGAEEVEGTQAFTRADGETWQAAMERQKGFLV